MPASSSSPPFIYDSDMSGGRFDPDPDLELFGVPQEASSFFGDSILLDNHSQYSTFGSPSISNQKSPFTAPSSSPEAKLHESAPSTASPTGSFLDSSSESSGYNKRKSSTESSRSIMMSNGDVTMGESSAEWASFGMDVGGENGENYPGTVDPSTMNMDYADFNDKSMENVFDFDSAASSPDGKTINKDSESPLAPPVNPNTPGKFAPPAKKTKNHNKVNSQHSIINSMNGLTTTGSRENSPLSAMTSQGSSPSVFFNTSPAVGKGMDFVNAQMLQQPTNNTNWPANFGGFSRGLPTIPQGPNMMDFPSMARATPNPQFPNIEFKPTLTIHPIPLKSRVETQIPITFTLSTLPQGVTKLHLPTHTISKPKLMCKPPPEKSPDMFELHASLVSTTAMLDPEKRRRALERAAQSTPIKEESSPSSVDDEDDPSKPINGADVKICPGCITREKKRAARKKIKKVEEEDSWHQYEAQRVVVFNTTEIKEWETPKNQPPLESVGDQMPPYVPPGAMQVTAPMRIACYCRHQAEKIGFRVIFTIKDYQERLIAQQMTASIMITDDHKTQIPPASLTNQSSTASDSQLYNGTGSFPTESFAAGPTGGITAFRQSHSSSDLQGMQSTLNFEFQQPVTSGATSQTTSATMTPRNLSRQASPLTSSGPISKKRKASGSGKVPSGLAMTRLEAGPIVPAPIDTAPVMSAPSSAAASPFTPNLSSFGAVPPQQNNHLINAGLPNLPQQFNTGPPTPNSNDQMMFSNANRSQSMENLAMHQLYSAPTSTHPSRAPSPNGLRNGFTQQFNQQQQFAQAFAAGMFSPMSFNPQQQQPIIHKLIPNEGPRAGGIEVTCLGSGFSQGLEVMFGSTRATTTTFWGETSLVCLLPPSALPGTVAVTFKHQHQPGYPSTQLPKGQQAYFTYIDDDEQELMKSALRILANKMTGRVEDVRAVAQRIINDPNGPWGASSGQSGAGSVNHQASGYNAAPFDVEVVILKCLDLIDLDDSTNLANFEMENRAGQTMLHLACSLGLNRVVAALLARGADPEAQDVGGFTPMHFAALNDQPQIVRRLMLSGAKPTIRSRQGHLPSDMTTTAEVHRAARRIEHHSRTRSGTSLKSRNSSATSLRSVWEPMTPAATEDDSSEVDSDADSSDDDNEGFYMKSRRGSAMKSPPISSPDESETVMELPGITATAGAPLRMAAMAVFRDQLAAQIQHFHQSMHLNLPNLPQMPRFDMTNLPNLPDYQQYIPASPMVRRISNLVNNNRPEGSKEQDYKWWDLFSNNSATAPPSYEEIFPQGDTDTKRSSAAQAAADAVADNKCSEMFDQVEGTTSLSGSSSTIAGSSTSLIPPRRPVLLDTVRIGQKHVITREQQDQLRLAHAEKLKRLSRDRNLFFIWIPILIVIIFAMLYNRVPQVWTKVSQVITTFQNRRAGHTGEARVVEV